MLEVNPSVGNVLLNVTFTLLQCWWIWISTSRARYLEKKPPEKFSFLFFFDFQVWHTMFIIHICVTSNAGHVKWIAEKSLSRYGAALVRQQTNLTFDSSFGENCRQIVNYSLRPRRKPLSKNWYQEKTAPRKFIQTNPHSHRIASKE